jgi:tRNA modification GTPase
LSGDEVIDSGMVVFFQSPHSYTGEDVVEFHCHGNPVIVSLVVDEAVSLGAVVADPGEFTKTASLNDKIDLAQAESVADLINAQSKSAVLAANSSLSGEFSNKINTLVDEVVRGRVVIEANIDFPEEDIESDLLNTIKKDLEICLEEVSRLLMGVREGVRLREGYSIATSSRAKTLRSVDFPAFGAPTIATE